MKKGRMVAAMLLGAALIAAGCARPATPAPTPVKAPPVATPSPGVVSTPTPPPTPAAVAKPTGELRIALSYLGAEVLDPTLGPASGVKLPTMHIYDYLVGATPDAEFSKELGLARDWEVSHGPKSSTYTFYLRKGIKFHNGDEVTAEDVKFGLEYFMRPGSVATYAGTLREMIERIEVPDPHKVVIYTKHPYAMLLIDLSPIQGAEGMVLPKKYMQEKGHEHFNRNPVGTGPYRFKEHVPGSYMRFEAVEGGHWLYGVPKYKTITLFLVPEETTRIAMLKVGQADIADVSREKVKELTGFNTFLKPDSQTVAVWIMNQWQSDTYLYDRRVREALNLAINREEIVKYLFEGQGKVTGDGWYSSWAIGYKPLPLYPYDPERAKALLKEAFPGGVEITINSYNRPGISELMRMNEAIAGMFKGVGIKVKLVPLDYATNRSLQAKGALPNAVAGMAAEVNRPVWTGGWRILYHSTGLLAMTKDPKLDGMIEAVERELDLTKFGERQWETAKYMRDNSVIVSILHTGSLFAANPKKVTQWNLGKRTLDINTLDLIQRK